jgi:hypothetical protein
MCIVTLKTITQKCCLFCDSDQHGSQLLFLLSFRSKCFTTPVGFVAQTWLNNSICIATLTKMPNYCYLLCESYWYGPWLLFLLWFRSKCFTTYLCFVVQTWFINSNNSTNKMQQFHKFIAWRLCVAQHVSGAFPPIIRSVQLHQEPLVLWL